MLLWNLRLVMQYLHSMEDSLTITKPQSNGAENEGPVFIKIGFADNKRPEFKEVRNKDWILFGEDNKFPDHLLYLYDKSSVHGAIINNKVKYIIGNGINITGSPATPDKISLTKVNRYGESMNKVLEKSCKDVEMFGGFYWQIIYNMAGGIKEIVHTPFQNIRKAKDKGWWHSECWEKYTQSQYKPVHIDEFDSAVTPGVQKKVQLFQYKEYRPGPQKYPLPGYFSALNDIETDAEISIYNLSVMKNGQFTGKLITFFGGKVTEEKAAELEKRWNKKFNGSNNAGKTMLAFCDGTEKEPNVVDLSTTDLDKLFDQLRKSTEGKIFAGHEVTTPVLFGIKDSGTSLSGDGTTLEMGYQIFRATYANAKQKAIEEVLDLFLPLIGQATQKIIPVDLLPGTAQAPGTAAPTNQNLTNMTGRQFQNLERIIRKYRAGKITKDAAAMMLKKSFGLGDEDIETMMAEDTGFDKDFTETEVAEMFAGCGKKRDQFSVIKSRKFSADTMQFAEQADRFASILKDEMPMTFADVKGNDASIVDLIRKDKRITSDIIAEQLDVEKSYVDARIKILTERGVLTQSSETIGLDTIIEHAVNTENIDKIDQPETVDVFIRYSYEPKPGLEPIIETTRPFCKRLIELDRFYSRSEIETISQRVGYSVWDRKGGWWGDSPECRHEWKKNTVIRKRK